MVRVGQTRHVVEASNSAFMPPCLDSGIGRQQNKTEKSVATPDLRFCHSHECVDPFSTATLLRLTCWLFGLAVTELFTQSAKQIISYTNCPDVCHLYGLLKFDCYMKCRTKIL